MRLADAKAAVDAAVFHMQVGRVLAETEQLAQTIAGEMAASWPPDRTGAPNRSANAISRSSISPQSPASASTAATGAAVDRRRHRVQSDVPTAQRFAPNAPNRSTADSQPIPGIGSDHG